MKQILAMTRKDIFLWAKRPGSWIIVFLGPLLFIWIVQAVFGGTGTPEITVYAVNEDESQASQQIMEALRTADNLVIEELDTRQEADRRVGSGDRLAALVVPEGFGSALMTSHGATIEIIIDPARAEQANIVIGLVNSALAPMMVDAEVSRGIETGVAQVIESFERGEETIPSEEEEALDNPTGEDNILGEQSFEDPGLVQESIDETGNTDREDRSDLDTLRTFFTAAIKGVVSSQVQEALENPQVQIALLPVEEEENIRRPSLLDFLVPGYSLMYVYFLIPSLALAVLEERQTGVLRRLLVAPVSRSQILLGKMLPYFLIAVVQFVFVLTASRFLFGIDLGHSLVAMGIVISSSALAMTGLGIMIASFAQSEGQADGLSIVIVLAMAVVSGAMFPNFAIPGLQLVTPHYWSMQGFLNVIQHGQDVSSILGSSGILLTMAAVFFTIGAVRFSINEQ